MVFRKMRRSVYFRIAQEALRNIKRHSGADRAEVRLEQKDGRLHLSVSDCGRGFDSNKPPAEHGIGIRSMEERLRLLGGKLEIQSRPWKELELTHGYHSRWLTRREGWIESTVQLTWEGDPANPKTAIRIMAMFKQVNALSNIATYCLGY